MVNFDINLSKKSIYWIIQINYFLKGEKVMTINLNNDRDQYLSKLSSSFYYSSLWAVGAAGNDFDDQ